MVIQTLVHFWQQQARLRAARLARILAVEAFFKKATPVQVMPFQRGYACRGYAFSERVRLLRVRL